VITPGNHDGVHLGHRALLRTAKRHAEAHGLLTRALTFDPHPVTLLHPNRSVDAITLQPRRRELLLGAGADQVRIQPFTTEFAALSPEDFVASLLAQGARALVVGPDFRFGHTRAGDVPLLERLGRERGFEVLIEPPYLLDGERVSSSRVRDALRGGDVALAARLLGRFHELTGKVQTGDQRGRSIGFPTANLASEPVLPPSDGVYAVLARDLDTPAAALLQGVANLGTRPTFAAGRSVEVHLFDFDGDLYGRELRVGFVARVRAEQRFANVAELRAQIEDDCRKARQLLAARDTELERWL
jgi:riboflavin kinase/FMN adenylyltransferase